MKDILGLGKIGLIVHYGEEDCQKVFTEYKRIYGENLSFICEDKKIKRYKH
jgi:hypothetical protein